MDDGDNMPESLRRNTNPLSTPSYTDDSTKITAETRATGGSNEQEGRNGQFGLEPDAPAVVSHRDSYSQPLNPFLFQDVFFGTPGRPSSQTAFTPGRVEHWLDKTAPIPRSGSRGLYSTVSHKTLQENLGNGTAQGRRPYPCLEPLLPYLQGILSPADASEMLEIYFNEQRNPIFKAASPYTITHVIQPSSVLHPTAPRPTSSVLLIVMLLCVAQTADIKIFDPPGARQRIVLDLYRLALDLMEPVDWDNYFRTSGMSQKHHIRHS